MRTEKEIVKRIRDLRKSIDKDVATLDAFEEGKYHFESFQDLKELANRLGKNIVFQEALLWVTEDETN